MAHADWNRRFFGSIKRETVSNRHPVVRGKIMVLEGFICRQAAYQNELVLMGLDMGMHADAGNSIQNGNVSLN